MGWYPYHPKYIWSNKINFLASLVSDDIILIEETTMIVDDKRVATIVDGTITESFFSVKQENLAHIFSILRNSLYSDKAGAIIREYCTNAYDAHIQSGISQTPIKIGCPTPMNCLLTIRDFGSGLSEEQIYNIYASYGESTKRNTNDQVGMMGLGSKSAFSYSDSFTIISHNDGMQKN
jgi:HSP90 family molecular chaperone